MKNAERLQLLFNILLRRLFQDGKELCCQKVKKKKKNFLKDRGDHKVIKKNFLYWYDRFRALENNSTLCQRI